MPETITPLELPNVVGGNEVWTSETLPFYDPATGQEIGHAADSQADDVEAAFRVAREAFRTFRRTTPAIRQGLLLALADAIEANVEQLLDAEVACTGKPRELTRHVEILRGADVLRFFAGVARVPSGLAQTEYVEGYSSSIRREPRGVIAQITPWNYPFMMAIWKIAPALAAGNTVVLKPAETTPWSTVELARIASGILPPGVLNVVCGGRDTGAAMVKHPDADMVAITGSTRAGSLVMASAAIDLKDVHLELGGKAPAVVFADADLDAAAAGIASAAFFNAGQDCTAVTRIVVEQAVADEFTLALARCAESLRVGSGDDADLGPLNSAAHLERVEAMIAGLPAHARIVTGGRRTGFGYGFLPTIVTGVNQDDAIVQEEVFGPVITVQPFENEAQALSLANGTPFALASSVWTKDAARAQRFSIELEFGCVWINCHQVLPVENPHGGFKHSGTGKDLSVFGFEDYSRIKVVTARFA